MSNLLSAFQTYTGITDPVISQLLTGVVFIVGIGIFFGVLMKFLCRLI